MAGTSTSGVVAGGSGAGVGSGGSGAGFGSGSGTAGGSGVGIGGGGVTTGGTGFRQRCLRVRGFLEVGGGAGVGVICTTGAISAAIGAGTSPSAADA